MTLAPPPSQAALIRREVALEDRRAELDRRERDLRSHAAALLIVAVAVVVAYLALPIVGQVLFLEHARAMAAHLR